MNLPVDTSRAPRSAVPSPVGIEEIGNSAPQRRVKTLPAVNADDHELIQKFLEGHTEAFGELVVRYQDRLFNALFSILGSADDAREVAQDAFVHAFQKLGTFRGEAAFYSWLFRIALNAAISRKRRERKGSTSVEAVREQSGHEPIDERTDIAPSYPLELLERQQMVRVALGQLSEEFRTVLVLKEMEGLKYEEIADILDCPVGTIRSRLHRARSELRGRLEAVLRDGDNF